MSATFAAVALSLDLAAAMSEGEGISGDAGTVRAVAPKTDVGGLTASTGSAVAGVARVPKRTTAVHRTAAVRPGPVKLIHNLASQGGANESGGSTEVLL
jgi:hypothetical protein